MRPSFAPVAIATVDEIQVFGVPSALAASEIGVTFHTGRSGMYGTSD
jgi:hypothetical protein